MKEKIVRFLKDVEKYKAGELKKIPDKEAKIYLDYNYAFVPEDAEKLYREQEEQKKPIEFTEEEKQIISELNESYKKIGNKIFLSHTDLMQINRVKEFEEKTKNFIFDESKTAKKCIFTFFKIDEDTAAIGYLIPKDTEEKVKKGKIEATIRRQIEQPIILTNKNSFLEISSGYEADYTLTIKNKQQIIRFVTIPINLERRLSLRAVEAYLFKQEPKINGRELFETISVVYVKYLYFSNKIWYKIHALWDIGTYFFLLFKAYPLFELRGMMGSAKTKTMTISSFLTFNATDIMINPSESALFRETHEKRPTKYIDEAEKLFKIEKGKVIADPRAELLNASYSYKGVVPRVEKIANRFVILYYYVYSPTMIGSINGLYGATEDRVIVHITTKAPSDDKRGDLEPTEDSEDWQQIRDKLYFFLLQNWQEVERNYSGFVNDSGLSNRDFQIWKPILVLAKYIDDDLYSEIREYALKVSDLKKFDYIPEGSFDYKILKAVMVLVDGGQDFIFLNQIVESIEGDFKPRNRTIAKKMDNFGFKDYKERRHIGDNSGYGYAITKEIFFSVVNPICPNLFDLSSLSSQSSQSYTETEEISEDNVKIGEDKREHREDGETSEDSSDLKDDDLVIFVKEKGSYDMQEFSQKFTEIRMQKLLSEGRLYENPAGKLRTL